jgi:hypothetical protein
MKPRSILAAAAVAAALALTGTACSSSGNASEAARSAAASLSANPQFQADKARLEQNMRKDFHPTHPIKSVKTVVAETFPGADVQKIVVFAVTSFKPAARHAGQARTDWENGVINYALQQGATGVHGQPSIPGVTTPSTTKTSPSP